MGAACNDAVAHEFWEGEELNLHINVLELKAALLALKTFAHKGSCTQVLLRVDNTTSLSYIDKIGGGAVVTYPESGCARTVAMVREE